MCRRSPPSSRPTVGTLNSLAGYVVCGLKVVGVQHAVVTTSLSERRNDGHPRKFS